MQNQYLINNFIILINKFFGKLPKYFIRNKVVK